jgi:hypothetical protein
MTYPSAISCINVELAPLSDQLRHVSMSLPRIIVSGFADFGFGLGHVQYRVLGLIVVCLDIVHGHLRRLLGEL